MNFRIDNDKAEVSMRESQFPSIKFVGNFLEGSYISSRAQTPNVSWHLIVFELFQVVKHAEAWAEGFDVGVLIGKDLDIQMLTEDLEHREIAI